MASNQYSLQIPDHWFSEYKRADDQAKLEIENKIFFILHENSTFPMKEISDYTESTILRNLSLVDSSDTYEDGVLKQNNTGVDLLYKYYPNIWDVRKCDAKMSMMEGFRDEKVLRRAIKKSLTYDGSILYLRRWLYLVGCGACSNFRPTAAKAIYELNAGKGAKIYDYAAGYGGRLLGAWSSGNVSEYVAVDPNTETFNNANKIIKMLDSKYKTSDLKIHCIGSEDFKVSSYPHYKSYFDIAFSSPQYFNTEIYSDEPTQSCIKFSTYKDWVNGFFRTTIHNAIDVLKPEGVFAINIFTNLPNIKKIIQSICAEKSFYLYKVDKLALSLMPGLDTEGKGRRSQGEAFKYEPIFYFRRG